MGDFILDFLNRANPNFAKYNIFLILEIICLFQRYRQREYITP